MMGLRVLYLHQYFATPAGATGTRSYEFARRWSAAGNVIRVITTRAADDSLPPAGAVSALEGIELDIVGVEYSQAFGFLRRLWSFVAYAILASWRVLIGPRYDVVLATSTPLTVAFPALVALWLRGMPLVFEVRDVWPDAAIDAGALRNPLLIWTARKLERAAYRSASTVVALSTGMRDRIVMRVPRDTPIHVVPNGSDLEMFARSAPEREAARQALGLSGELAIVYTGTLGIANDVDHLVSIMEQTAHVPDIVWFVAGRGNAASTLITAMRAHDFRSVRYLGALPKTELRSLLQAADVGVVSFVNTPTYFDNSPNKFFDYAAAGVPSLFTRSTWLGPLLHRYGAGWVDETHDPAAAAQLLLDLERDRSAVVRASIAARLLARDEFGRDALSERYLELLSSAARKNVG